MFEMGTGVSPERISTGKFEHLTRSFRVLYETCSPQLGEVLSNLVRGTSRLASDSFLLHNLHNRRLISIQNPYFFFLRKEVIQPHLPIRLPCYDFTPVTCPAFGSSFLSVRSLTSGIADSHGVTGGVYKTRERIHRDILIRDY